MGSWGAGIWSGDTAQDLRSEYTCAFYKYGVDEALQRLDEYVRSEFGDDEDEWCSFRYSLADFMWKKGILTPEIRDNTIGMIDSGYAMATWEGSGAGAVRERTKVLEKFRAQLLSAQPAPKKIKPDVHMTDVFSSGDHIAIQLQTAGKKYSRIPDFQMSDEKFHSFDGKFIVIQKLSGHASWRSMLVPEICDYWLTFRLCAGIFDEPPTFEQACTLPDALFDTAHGETPQFWCESSLVYFRRRKYKLLGNSDTGIDRLADLKEQQMVTFGNDYDHCNPDSEFIAAIKRAQTK